MSVNNGTRTRRWPFGTASFGLFVLAALGLGLLHVLRPDYAPRSHMISDYAVGPYGWVMQVVFVSLSLADVMLAIGLLRDGPRSILARLAILLLAVASVGLVLSALFATDIPGAPHTLAGAIHNFSFLVNVTSSLFATIFLSLSFGRDTRWRSYRGAAVGMMLLVLVALVVQFKTLHRGMPYGYANRLFVLVAFAWSGATALRLRAVERDRMEQLEMRG